MNIDNPNRNKVIEWPINDYLKEEKELYFTWKFMSGKI